MPSVVWLQQQARIAARAIGMRLIEWANRGDGTKYADPTEWLRAEPQVCPSLSCPIREGRLTFTKTQRRQR